MCLDALNICLCIMYWPGAQEGQKRALYPWRLELQIAVIHDVDAGDQTQMLWKSGQRI